MIARNKSGPPEFLIYSAIGDGPDEISARAVAAWLDAIPDGTPKIIVRINSPGGDVFSGVAILNSLIAFPGTVDVYIDGLAASAASFIAMAGTKIYMAESATEMLHLASGGVWGPASDMESTAKVLKKLDNTIAGIYARRTGRSVSYFLDLMAAETWLDAREAKALGLVDEILVPSQSRMVATFQPNALRQYRRKDRIAAYCGKCKASPPPSMPRRIRQWRPDAVPEQATTEAVMAGHRDHASVLEARLAVEAMRSRMTE